MDWVVDLGGLRLVSISQLVTYTSMKRLSDLLNSNYALWVLQCQLARTGEEEEKSPLLHGAVVAVVLATVLVCPPPPASASS